MGCSENVEKCHRLELKEPSGDLKESEVPMGSVCHAFLVYSGEGLNQEEDIRSVLEKMTLLAVGRWIGVVRQGDQIDSH